MSKIVRGMREHSVTAVASAVGCAIALAAIAVDAGAGTVFRSFVAEELASGSGNERAWRTRLAERRGKLKAH